MRLIAPGNAGMQKYGGVARDVSESLKVPNLDPKLSDSAWIREKMLKVIRSGMEGFVEYWTEELGGVHKIDSRLKGMSALEVNEIYMSSLVEEPLEIIEQLYAWSREGKEPRDWIRSYQRYVKALLDRRECMHDVEQKV